MLKKLALNKFSLLAILVILFFAFSYIEGNTFFEKKEDEENLKEAEQVEEKELNEELSEQIIEEEIAVDNNEDIIISSPTNTPQPSGSIDVFVYPNGNVIEKNTTELKIESFSNPAEITNWYKEKIKEFDMNATSVVSTNTNGNVLNKIAASNGNMKIEIEISRSNSQEKASITVKLL